MEPLESKCWYCGHIQPSRCSSTRHESARKESARKLRNCSCGTKQCCNFYFILQKHLHIICAIRSQTHRTRLRKYSNLLRCLVVMLLLGAVSGFPKLCAEPDPIDLLAHALSNAQSLPRGVEVVPDDDDVKGYRFDTSARLLGVESETIFPLCNKFPSEFSILLTFQHHVRRSTNEFLATLLAPDQHKAMVALRLQRDRLSFDYASKYLKKTASVSMKSSAFSDGNWHTVVISVTSNVVKFTLDCETPQKRKLSTPFPKKLNIKRTKIYVASRRKKRKRFTGLLRQLVLLPGADASVRICPAANPALATLNDESSSPANPTLSLIFEKRSPDVICSTQNRGTLMYSEDMTMKICDENSFRPVRGGPERMDYVIDYEDIITDNFTVSIEKFSIPGEGLFIATANNDDLKKNTSHIFMWDERKFRKIQDLKTNSAMMWKYFEIGKEYFLAVANTGKPGESGVTSTIYRWARKRKKFVFHQSLRTFGARSIEAFSIESSMHFLVVANQRHSALIEGDSMSSSVIYKWDPDIRIFRFYHQLPTVDALDITFFRIVLNLNLAFDCLVVANAFNGETSHVNSEIYCWNPFTSTFQLRQSIETVGAADWEFFQFNDRYFLAVANSFDKLPNEEPKRFLNSSIYELNLQYQQFILYQQIETHGANDWEFFQIGTQYFLVVSNTVSAVSEVYRWKGIEKFVKVHSLPVGSCSDFDHIPINGDHYLASANPNGKLSKLFKILTY